MTHYTILPDGVYWEHEEQEETYGEIELGGMLMQVRIEPGNRATIVRLLRCNLEDYLNPDFAPGKQITFYPALLK